MNIASLIKDCLFDHWSETNPTAAKITWKYDEFDPKNPSLQVLIENFPQRSTWVIRGVYRVEHRARITVYLKLVRYELDNIENSRTTWFNAKVEIDKILDKNKFSIPGIVNLNLSGGWDDKNTIAVGRGMKTRREPIVWQTEQIVTAQYYIDEELVGE